MNVTIKSFLMGHDGNAENVWFTISGQVLGDGMVANFSFRSEVGKPERLEFSEATVSPKFTSAERTLLALEVKISVLESLGTIRTKALLKLNRRLSHYREAAQKQKDKLTTNDQEN